MDSETEQALGRICQQAAAPSARTILNYYTEAGCSNLKPVLKLTIFEYSDKLQLLTTLTIVNVNANQVFHGGQNVGRVLKKQHRIWYAPLLTFNRRKI